MIRVTTRVCALMLMCIQTSQAWQVDGDALSQRFAGLALDCVHQEYPNKIAHVLESDQDAQPPRMLTPAFYGCYDWHSSVHGHWLLVRLLRQFPDQPFAERARAALNQSLTMDHLSTELSYMDRSSRRSFERPYGLAWLLQLITELRQFDDPDARRWLAAINPLERLVEQRLAQWLSDLSYPVRTGEHSQTAFAFGLMLDWAREADRSSFESLLIAQIRSFYLKDEDCPVVYEPGGQDFLSPCLAEADLMRRVLAPEMFADWLSAFMPGLSGKTALYQPEVVTDKSDGKLAHLDGLNLSRAWMLEGMVSALPSSDPRLGLLRRMAADHARAGLAAANGEDYAGGHWLGSFAVYLVTHRGLPRPDSDSTDAD